MAIRLPQKIDPFSFFRHLVAPPQVINNTLNSILIASKTQKMSTVKYPTFLWAWILSLEVIYLKKLYIQVILSENISQN